MKTAAGELCVLELFVSNGLTVVFVRSRVAGESEILTRTSRTRTRLMKRRGPGADSAAPGASGQPTGRVSEVQQQTHTLVFT